MKRILLPAIAVLAIGMIGFAAADVKYAPLEIYDRDIPPHLENDVDHVQYMTMSNTQIPDTDIHAIAMYTVDMASGKDHHMVINQNINMNVGESIHWFDYGLSSMTSNQRVIPETGRFLDLSAVILNMDNGHYTKQIITQDDDSGNLMFTAEMLFPGEYLWIIHSPESHNNYHEANTFIGKITVSG